MERSGRMTSREYLRGMMGVENSAVMEVSKGLVMAGNKPAEAEKKARIFEQSEEELLNHSVQAFQSIQE